MTDHLKNDSKIKPANTEAPQRLEFYRDALALLPAPEDPYPGVAYFLEIGKSGPQRRVCDCSTAKDRTCRHILELSEIYKGLRKSMNGRGPFETYRQSVWYQLAALLADRLPDPFFDFLEHHDIRKRPHGLRIAQKKGPELFSYFSSGPDLERFLERCADFLFASSPEEIAPRRCEVLKKLQSYSLTPDEYALHARGLVTRGRAVDESIWFRWAYHGFREFTGLDARFHPFIENRTGAFMLLCKSADGRDLCRFSVPRHLVKAILNLLRQSFPDQPDLAVHPVPLKTIFNITLNTELDLEVRPVIELLQQNGEKQSAPPRY